MVEITEILKYTLPLLIIGGAVLLVIHMFFRQERVRLALSQKAETMKTILPLRLQAYERIILFLERSEPSQVILRLLDPQASARDLHRECIVSIREEFEHNFTQQLYISPKAWEALKVAKESVIHLINKSYEELSERAGANELAMKILEKDNLEAMRQNGIAISQIKKEVQDLF